MSDASAPTSFPHRSVRMWVLITTLLVILAGMGLVFGTWTATSWTSFPKFCAASLLLFLLPGRVLMSLVRGSMSRLESLVLSMLVGLVTTSALYWVATVLDLPWLIWVWVASSTALTMKSGTYSKNFLKMFFHETRWVHFALVLVIAAAILPLGYLPYYFSNLAAMPPDGFRLVGVLDMLLHASVASELTHTIPPQMPFLSGERLSYHVGIDLVAAVLARYGGLSIMDLVVRFCPTMFAVLNVLAVYCLAHRLTSSAWAGVWTALVVVFGEDFSFVGGLLNNRPNAVWSAYYLQAPTTFSLYFVNPMALALGMFFGTLLVLYRSAEEEGSRWWLPAAILMAGLIQTKIFFFVQLSLALGITAMVWLGVYRQIAFLKVGLAILALGLPIFLSMYLRNATSGPLVWGWSNGLAAYVAEGFRRMGIPFLASHLWMGLPVYLVLVFGARIAGVSALLSALRPRRRLAFTFCIAVFVLLGPILSLSMHVVPRDYPRMYNNAIWFLVQSKYAAWVFAACVVCRLAKDWGKPAGSVVACLLVAVSVVSSVQFFRHMEDKWSYHAREVSKPVMESMDYLRETARPGSVVMTEQNPLMLAAGRFRLPYHDVFLRFSTPREEVERRQAAVGSFWRSWQAGVIETRFLRTYGVEWIVAMRGATPASLAEAPELARERVRLKKAYENPEVIVFRVRRVD